MFHISLISMHIFKFTLMRKLQREDPTTDLNENLQFN